MPTTGGGFDAGPPQGAVPQYGCARIRSGRGRVFDPSNACQNALAYNDNANLAGCVKPAEVSAVVDSGYCYIVVSSFETETAGTYTLSVTAPGSDLFEGCASSQRGAGE